MPQQQIMFLVGEASADGHASRLIHSLKSHNPNIHCFGMGGAKMRAAGAEILFDPTQQAVVGFIEILLAYRRFRKIFYALKKALITRKPDLVVLVDFSGFNLKFAKVASEAGIRTAYYIAPQIWASRFNRIERIKRYVNQVMCIWPFEVPLYQDKDIPVAYVGHPLLGRVKPSLDREAARAHFNLHETGLMIGLLPGSRKQEIENLLPIMLASATRIHEKFPDSQFILPLAHTVSRESVQANIQESGLPVTLITDKRYDAMNVCDVLLCVSGTVTLEAGLLGIPMVVIYKVSALTAWLARRLITIPHISLCNIVAGREIVKECLQEEANPETISGEAVRILEDKAYADQIRGELGQLRDSLEGNHERLDPVDVILSNLT